MLWWWGGGGDSTEGHPPCSGDVRNHSDTTRGGLGARRNWKTLIGREGKRWERLSKGRSEGKAIKKRGWVGRSRELEGKGLKEILLCEVCGEGERREEKLSWSCETIPTLSSGSLPTPVQSVATVAGYTPLKLSSILYFIVIV